MQHTRYPVLSGSSEVLPTTNGSFFTGSMATAVGDNFQVYVEFYSDAAGTVPVTPTAGTVTVTASPLGNVYLGPSNVTNIDATKVAYPAGTYTPPQFVGRAVIGQATFANVAGAAYARVTFWNY